MPVVRLLGNAALSFLTKLSTGYWNIFDPTNGYIAADARLLAVLQRDKIDKGYFFETDFLFRVGLLHAKVMDIPMTAVYGDQESNLRIRREVVPFFVRNIRNFGKRLFYNYFLRDFNVASLEIGITHWGVDKAATAGTVMIAALPLLTGIMLLLSFINFDAQQIPRETISSRLPVSRQRDSFPR
jgi:hypothetical protein